MMTWSSRKKKEGIFCAVYFVWRKFFNIFVLSQCMVYWIHFQNIHTFTYQKTLLHRLLLLVFKIIESLQCILKFLKIKLKFKRATKFNLMHYLGVVIILFSTGLYKSAFSTCSFDKTRFSSFTFYFFCSMFWIHCHLKRFKDINREKAP